jgi:hypothetical protein
LVWAVLRAVATIDNISFASDKIDISCFCEIIPVDSNNSIQKTYSSASSTTILILDRNSGQDLTLHQIFFTLSPSYPLELKKPENYSPASLLHYFPAN